MRKAPIEVEEIEVVPVDKDDKNHFVDLSDILSEEPRNNNPDETDNISSEENEEETKEQTKTTTTVSGTFEDFKDKAEQQFSEYLEDPEALGEMVVGFYNTGRLIFWPGLYEGFHYPGQERNDIREVMRKAKENEIANRPPTDGFNNYELRLFNKWPLLQDAIQNVSFKEDEIKKLGRMLGNKIVSSPDGVPGFMKKYDWLFYMMWLETKKATPIFQGRASDMFSKKFGG